MSGDIQVDVTSAAQALAKFDAEVSAARRLNSTRLALADDPGYSDRWLEAFDAHVAAGRRSLAAFVLEVWPEQHAQVKAWLRHHQADE